MNLFTTFRTILQLLRVMTCSIMTWQIMTCSVTKYPDFPFILAPEFIPSMLYMQPFALGNRREKRYCEISKMAICLEAPSCSQTLTFKILQEITIEQLTSKSPGAIATFLAIAVLRFSSLFPLWATQQVSFFVLWNTDECLPTGNKRN